MSQKTVSVKIPRKTVQDYRRLAKQEGRTMSYLMDVALRAYLIPLRQDKSA